MQLENIVGDYKTTTLTHHDGNSRKAYYTNRESSFPEGEKVISVTDLAGDIIKEKGSFARLSGYAERELIGAPHYVLNPPDMPKSIFKSLWGHLNDKKEWHGHIKNLRKDGCFYWVVATILSLHHNNQLSGYMSFRRAATTKKIIFKSKLYQNMFAKEQA